MNQDEQIKRLLEVSADPQKMQELAEGVAEKVKALSDKAELVNSNNVELTAFVMGIAALCGNRDMSTLLLLEQTVRMVFLLGVYAGRDIPDAFKEAFE